MVKNIWLLKNGYLDLEKSVMVASTGFGEKLPSPVFSTLVEMEDGKKIMIDTGLNPLGIDDPAGTWGPRAALLPPHMKREDDLKNRLAQIGRTPDEIDYIITTHMHWDHTGGNLYFPEATFVVQRSEYQYAFNPDPRIAGSYMRNHFDFDHQYELVEGDASFASGIYLFHTPGHTPGHMSVLLTKSEGTRYLISGDAVYLQENLGRMMPPGNCWDPGFAVLSLNRVKTMSELMNATVLASHDPFAEWPEDGIKKL